MPGVFSGGKGGRCVRLTTLPPSCAVVMKSGNLNFLQPSGHLGPLMGLIYFLYSGKNTDSLSLNGVIISALQTSVHRQVHSRQVYTDKCTQTSALQTSVHRQVYTDKCTQTSALQTSVHRQVYTDSQTSSALMAITALMTRG